MTPQIASLCTVTTTTSHISCILESTPCGELCTVTAPRSCPVFTCDYLFCFWMCLIEVFVLFMSIIPSKLLSYLLPTLTINTLSIVQSAAKSEHNAAWEVLAAVLQSAVRSSGGGGVETSFPQQNKYISTFPIFPAVENYNFVYRVSHTFNFAGWNGILNFMNFKQLNL